MNDDSTTRTQFHVRLKVDQTTGNIGVVWYDARLDSGNATAHLYAGMSADGFYSAPPNFRVTQNLSDPALPEFGGDSFREYIGLDFFRSRLIPAWLDNSNNPNNNPNGTSKFDIHSAVIPF